MISLAVNPNDQNNVYGVTTLSNAFESADGSSSWNDITVAGSLLDTSADESSSIAYISKGPSNTIVMGTSNGILVPTDGTSGWKVLAVGLPKVLVYDMVYEETNDILIVATLGHSLWFLNLASQAVAIGGITTAQWLPMDKDSGPLLLNFLGGTCGMVA